MEQMSTITFMTTEALFLPIAMAAASGLVGCFAVMRRMTLAGDALSHVALPGIGIAIALGINPLLGAVTMLFFGALLVWALEGQARVATETVVGVVFSVALAIGAMMASGEDLIETLFGGAGVLSRGELVFGLAASCVVVAFILTQKDKLVVMLVSSDVAKTAGINVRLLDFLYLETFSLTIALGLRYLGALLMGALIIIPAATAKQLARSLSSMLIVATVVALIATLAGTALAEHLHRGTGPFIVTTAGAIFLLSLLYRRR
jgi:ABC-type Mn2+/Zn2+ transport system permease subunit